MKKIKEISDYKILGYTESDKDELKDRKAIEAKIVDINKLERKKFVKFIVDNSKSF